VLTATEPGFGLYLRTASDLEILAAYREATRSPVALMPRLVVYWRAAEDAAERDNFSPAQFEKWLLDIAGVDDEDLADCRICAVIWMARQ
jgi:hypothetical protein